jgi:hypothetical protein
VAQSKRPKLDKDDLERELFRLFEQKPNWNVPDLQVCSPCQPRGGAILRGVGLPKPETMDLPRCSHRAAQRCAHRGQAARSSPRPLASPPPKKQKLQPLPSTNKRKPQQANPPPGAVVERA